MKIRHLSYIHAVDVVRRKNRHEFRPVALDEMAILINGVSSALVLLPRAR
jgi:hypothetical protein